jgi:hypothetical protein
MRLMKVSREKKERKIIVNLLDISLIIFKCSREQQKEMNFRSYWDFINPNCFRLSISKDLS